MNLRYGLQAKFLGMMGLALLVVLALMVLLWSRQERMQHAVEGVTRETMDAMESGGLRRRGEGVALQLAESLANPLYYFDLDAVGVLGRATLRQPGTSYVIVYDGDGNVLHDGSEEIPSYGKRMDDAMAYEVIAARALHTQWSDKAMDVSVPILIGDQRIGGVRIGFDLLEARRHQDSAIADLRGRLSEIGRRQLTWVGLLSVALLGLGHTPASFNTADLVYKEIDLIASRAYTPATWRRLPALLAAQHSLLARLATHRLPLAKAAEGIELMKARKGLKILFTPEWAQ